ncbi:MAG: hypothetical protein HGA85_05885, partial [Nanoarchaeota archaeon]|nr:hypothetical protein [Nanoarchaeota archaeon]
SQDRIILTINTMERSVGIDYPNVAHVSVSGLGLLNSSQLRVTQDGDLVSSTESAGMVSFDAESTQNSISYVITGSAADDSAPSITSLSSQGVTNGSAYIVAEMDESANLTVSVNSQTLVNASYRTTSSIFVSGLSPSTHYDYSATVCDISGNCVSSSGSFDTLQNYVDTTAPAFLNLSSQSVTNQSAYIMATMNESANLTVSVNSQTLTNISYGTASRVFASGLAPNTHYNYSAIACDASGNCASSSGSFDTLQNYLDTTAPVFLNLSSQGVTNQSAYIVASMNESANLTVSVNSQTLTNVSYATSVSVLASGLSPDTRYNYSAMACDLFGNCVSSSGSFNTSQNYIDTSVPSVVSAANRSITSSGFSIDLYLNESGTAVLYLDGIEYEQKSEATYHDFIVSGLSPNTSYTWKVNGSDPNGNRYTTSTYTLRTSSDSMLPNSSRFSGTDFTDTEYNSAANVSLDIAGKGRITFKPAINYSGLDLNSYVDIDTNKAAVNSSYVPQLNGSARIELYGLNVSVPRLLADGSNCTVCTLISYSNGTVIFDVEHFTAYSVGEGAVTSDSDEPDNDNGGGSSGSRGGSSGGGGGGGGGSPKVLFPEKLATNQTFEEATPVLEEAGGQNETAPIIATRTPQAILQRLVPENQRKLAPLYALFTAAILGAIAASLYLKVRRLKRVAITMPDGTVVESITELCDKIEKMKEPDFRLLSKRELASFASNYNPGAASLMLTATSKKEFENILSAMKGDLFRNSEISRLDLGAHGTPFTFMDGRQVKSLAAMTDALSVISDDEFAAYVNRKTNAIAEWAVQFSPEVASMLGKTKTKTAMIALLRDIEKEHELYNTMQI